MIKVLHISSDYEPNSLWGMGKSIHVLRQSFSKRISFGIQVYIATTHKSKNIHSNIITSKKKHDDKLLSLDGCSIFNNFNNFLKWNNYLAEEIIKNIPSIDVIHCHNWMSWITVRKIQKYYKCKIVSSCHFLQKQYDSMMENPIINYHREIIDIEKDMLKKSNAVVVFSNPQKKFLINKYKINNKKIHIIKHPVDVPLSKNKKEDIKTKTISVVFVGRVTKDKGVKELVNSIKLLHKKYPNLNLKIIGNNQLRDFTKKQPEFIKFLGQLSSKQVFKELLTSDIFCLPSISESFGIAVVESMFCGLPVISCSGNNNPKLFTNNKSGFYCSLIKQNKTYKINEECLYNKLNLLIKKPKLRKQMGENAKKEAQTKYSVKKALIKYTKIYQLLI